MMSDGCQALFWTTRVPISSGFEIVLLTQTGSENETAFIQQTAKLEPVAGYVNFRS